MWCSGHTVLLEDSINIASLLSRNGFAPPLSDPEASTSSSSSATTSQSMPPARAEYSTQPTSRLQKRKHAVPDERFDELGNILEPWKVSREFKLVLNNMICYLHLELLVMLSAG